jgi:cell division protein FtsB
VTDAARTPRSTRRLPPLRLRRRAALREAVYLAGLLATAGTLYTVLVLLPSRMKTGSLRDRHDALAHEVEETRKGTAELRKEAAALRDDPWVVERALRQRLGYLRPGERVFQTK